MTTALTVAPCEECGLITMAIGHPCNRTARISFGGSFIRDCVQWAYSMIEGALRAALEPFGPGLTVSATPASHGQTRIEVWYSGHLLIYRDVPPRGRSARAAVNEILRLNGFRVEAIHLRLTGAVRTNASCLEFPKLCVLNAILARIDR